nr:hypothetical protein HK105_006214 [Polyrhizophydium stewartii]
MASADVEAALSSIVDECFDLRARILDVERAAAPSPAPLSATLPPRSAAAAAAAAAAAEPALGRAKDALFEPPADQNLEAGSSISGSTRASPEPGAVPPDPFLVRSPSVASSAASQMSRPTLQRQPAVDAKDVTRFLATNGLEIASTVAGIAGAAAHFAPVPGLGAAVATIDDTVRYLQLDVDAPFAVKEYCADLADIKAVLAPMSNQWFSPDVQRRCEVLLTLLRDAQQLLEHARSETHSWTIPLGAAASKFDAQIEGFRRQLGRARELLFLSMQVDSAAMLMRMAKQLNIIDVKPERLLS